MPRPNRSLKLLVLLIAVIALFATASVAQAHRLDAQAFLLPGNKLQVEGWFSSGEPARGAVVRIHGTEEHLICEGKLDDQGIFVCTLKQREPLYIVVIAGAEHRKELHVSVPEGMVQTSQPLTLADRNASAPFRDIVIGLAFLLALAAFVMAYRSSRRITGLMERLKNESDKPSDVSDSNAR
jgi:hypothetical protein